MSSLTAFDTIKQYLDAQWTTTPLVYENADFQKPRTPAAFVVVEIFGDFYDQASLGAETRTANLWREEGQLYLHVMTPRNTGSTTARTHAQNLIALFQGQDIGTLTFRSASIGTGEPGEEWGNYYQMTATIQWQRDQ
jgi:hypothetical protein